MRDAQRDGGRSGAPGSPSAARGRRARGEGRAWPRTPCSDRYAGPADRAESSGHGPRRPGCAHRARPERAAAPGAGDPRTAHPRGAPRSRAAGSRLRRTLLQQVRAAAGAVRGRRRGALDSAAWPPGPEVGGATPGGCGLLAPASPGPQPESQGGAGGVERRLAVGVWPRAEGRNPLNSGPSPGKDEDLAVERGWKPLVAAGGGRGGAVPYTATPGGRRGFVLFLFFFGDEKERLLQRTKMWE